MIRVADVMQRDVITMTSDKTSLDAARIMRHKNIGCVIIAGCHDNICDELQGIVTEKDLVHKVAAFDKKPSEVKLEEIMTTKVITTNSGETLGRISAIMSEHNFRRMPVVEEGKLIGILTTTDIIKQGLI